VDPDTNTTYSLNTRLTNFTVAEAACNSQGGHLVSYASLQEQRKVEEFFVAKGMLFPTCHGSYWMGLHAPTWPNFEWQDPTAPDLTQPDAYRNWGTFVPSSFPSEPNQLFGDENCGVGNYSEAVNDAWGWADATCDLEFVSICKFPRERLRKGL
jgi:hypothetical protein